MRLMPIAQLIIVFLPAVTAFADDNATNKERLSTNTSIASSGATAVFVDDNPTYREGLLTIPRIDTTEQVGKYQDVQLKPTADGTWQLLSLKEMAVLNAGSRLTIAPIYKVEMTTTSSFPTQVFLKLFGLNTMCGSLSPAVHQRFDGNHFEVVLNEVVYEVNQVLEGGVIIHGDCAIPTTFAKTIPLPVYGLKAGTYSYSVASTDTTATGLTGTFKLTADNASVSDSTPDPNYTAVCAVCKTQP